ncbi:MAG TPA: tRNA (adenosine(37)-N6)-threonylcarbamoyltransferase complex dimerization subunit type 1 TsaB [Candidatus Desulfofervidus auxilii]|uniref:tRNA (Adenosine(37)-N6)-threonylcarbamoyltransferase complex dimerization subunit type 1 TsaB n=1 Tax=Desulfofervidus auxilii TaxID=1621989 RepID=A0A7C0U4A1_DESA2|nr:tRNA (adenosine(37)-N6)-threonylcarbamoyltransferase complex dimerization subunit type 1 TsaB [Candidatus Desulfofervidus auxilii]
MKILTIDTSTSIGSVAIVEEGEIKGEVTLNLPLTHNQRLIKSLETLLRITKISFSEIDLLAVIKGPGSFTGLRIGVATAKGLAFALKKPLIGVNGLDTLAYNFSYISYLICPMLDARKKQVFAAFYIVEKGEIKRISDYYSIFPEILLKDLRRKTIFIGTGALIYKELIRQKLKEKAIFPPSHLHRIHPETIAQLALKAIEKGEKTDPITFVPFYIRPSDAEINFYRKD